MRIVMAGIVKFLVFLLELIDESGGGDGTGGIRVSRYMHEE